MTRDEAIKLRLDHIGPTTKAIMPAAALQEITAAEVDFYIATGMLRIDDPKSANERAVDAMFGHPKCSMSGLLTPRWAMEALDAAGLRIVEK